MTASPLPVACPECGSEAGSRCLTRSGLPARKAHKRRAVLAAHSDPALDEFFKRLGPCGFCGWLPQRHRVVDAIAERLAAGEDPGDVAADHLVSLDAVRAVREWAERWGL